MSLFVDEVQISVRSGDGGTGCVSYRRERFLPHGGPDGGNGGKGGDVIFKVDPYLTSLADLAKKHIYRAENGQSGGKQKQTGKNGKDLILKVPQGTLLKDEDANTLHDLCDKTTCVTLLEGGRGGKGNHFFRNSRNQAPSFAQKGESGQEIALSIELRLLADVGLVGFPNVGKSTLLARISAARPKIGDYHFTTLHPALGILELPDQEPLTIADIPGLVRDAHKDVGLGWRFLKHIERTRGLVYVIDALSEKPFKDYQALKKELFHYHQNKTPPEESSQSVFSVPKIYSSQLLKQELDLLEQPLYDRPHLVALNKVEMLTAEQLDQILSDFKEHKILAIPLSAKDGLGLKTFLSRTYSLLALKNQSRSHLKNA